MTDPPEDDTDPRHHLLADLARRAIERPGRSTWLEHDARASYAVEDEARRVRAALDRLEPVERAALILTRYAGVPEGFLRRALPGFEREGMAARASERVALAAGRAKGAPVIDLLNRLLIDAPAADLWEAIADDLRATWARRRRRQRALTAAVTLAVVALLGGAVVWLAGLGRGREGGDSQVAEATPAPTLPPIREPLAAFAAATRAVEPVPAISVPDLHLFRMIEQVGGGRSALMLYDADRNQTSPLLDAGGYPAISPDGRYVVAVRTLREPPGMAVLAGAPVDRGGDGWELQLPAPRALVIGADAVYVLNLRDAGRYQIQIIGLRSGQIEAAWALADHDVTPDSVRAVRLALAPDGLAVLASRFDPALQQRVRTLTTYRPEDGEVMKTITYERGEDRGGRTRDFSISGARPVPGEPALYSVVPEENGRELRVQFIDLDSGALSGVTLPLLPRTSIEGEARGENEVHLIPSNTGQLLYVIQSRQRQVAVVDMRGRSLIGVFPLDAGPYDRIELESALNRVTYMEAVLSPDGARLYMANNREKNQSINGYPSQSPVWVFDTSSWQVVDRWMVGGLPRTMTMSGDGSRVYLHTARSDGNVHLTVFDAATGEVLDVRREIPGPEWSDVQRIASLTGLYHAQYGVRPAVDDVVPGDNAIVSVLPGIALEAEGAVAGAEAIITVRVVHPVTGEPAAGDPGLRFDPAATLAIELTHGEQRTIFVPAPIEPGVYRARTWLAEPGIWAARVTMVNPDGTAWTLTSPAALNVTAGLAASDGGNYRFSIRPGNPVTRRTISLRVWLVEAGRGERLQQDIQFLDSIVGAPTLILSHPSGEHHELLLEPLDHASYIGWARFGEPGEWSARIVLELASGERVTINAGTLEIGDLLAPYARSNSGSSGGGASNTSSPSRNGHSASQ